MILSIKDILHNDTQQKALSIIGLCIAFSYCYVECHYAECHYAECRYAECRYAECHYDASRGPILVGIVLPSSQGKLLSTSRLSSWQAKMS